MAEYKMNDIVCNDCGKFIICLQILENKIEYSIKNNLIDIKKALRFDLLEYYTISTYLDTLSRRHTLPALKPLGLYTNLNNLEDIVCLDVIGFEEPTPKFNMSVINKFIQEVLSEKYNCIDFCEHTNIGVLKDK